MSSNMFFKLNKRLMAKLLIKRSELTILLLIFKT